MELYSNLSIGYSSVYVSWMISLLLLTLLLVFCFNSHVGYNHPSLLKTLNDPLTKSLLAARPALGSMPPSTYVETVESTLMSVSYQ